MLPVLCNVLKKLVLKCLSSSSLKNEEKAIRAFPLARHGLVNKLTFVLSCERARHITLDRIGSHRAKILSAIFAYRKYKKAGSASRPSFLLDRLPFRLLIMLSVLYLPTLTFVPLSPPFHVGSPRGQLNHLNLQFKSK